MDDEETAKDVEYFANVIRAQFSMASWAGPPDTEIALHLMRSSEGEVECHYYLASWTFRSIFWLKKVPVGLITGTSLSHVVSQAHLGALRSDRYPYNSYSQRACRNCHWSPILVCNLNS